MEPLTGEREWIRRFQSGDASAFVAIMNHYEPYILGLLTRLAGDRTRAEDLCQETFLKALKGLPSFRRDSSLKTWLFRIAHNTATDQARAEGHENDSLDQREETGLQTHSNAPSPQSRVEEAQMQRSVEEAMASLPQSQREVLHLFYWDELSVGDIASALRMPEGTVKTLLFRGRNALRGRVLNLLPEVTS